MLTRIPSRSSAVRATALHPRPAWSVAAAAGAIALMLSVVPAAGAASGTFGANLDAAAANNTAGDVCSAGIPPYGLPAGPQSCMFTYFGTGLDSLFTPVTGTVTAIHVKVGNVTGRMRVNVVRFLYQQTSDPGRAKTVAGPFLEAYGPEFTPNANATTQVPTNLRVQLDPNPPPGDTSTIQVSDALALEIEAPNVPIPFAANSAALSLYATYPGPTQQGLQAPSPNGIPNTRQIAGANIGLLMNADLTTGAPDVPPPSGPTGAGGATPTVSLPAARVFRVRDGTTAIPLLCRVADCAGRVTLQGGATGRATVAATKTYGSARFSAKAGATARPKIRLNAAGRALLRDHAKATIYARVRFTRGGGATRRFRVTLRR